MHIDGCATSHLHNEMRQEHGEPKKGIKSNREAVKSHAVLVAQNRVATVPIRHATTYV